MARNASWKRLQSTLSRALHEHDPDGMGSSFGAPDDEYDDRAIDLIRSLQGNPEVESAVRALWPNASARLVANVADAWTRYGRESS